VEFLVSSSSPSLHSCLGWLCVACDSVMRAESGCVFAVRVLCSDDGCGGPGTYGGRDTVDGSTPKSKDHNIIGNSNCHHPASSMTKKLVG
jgi:hypothetical protein